MKPRCNYQIGLSLVAVALRAERTASRTWKRSTGWSERAERQARTARNSTGQSHAVALGWQACSCPSPAISIPTTKAHARAHAVRIAHTNHAGHAAAVCITKHVPTVRPISHRRVESSNSGNPALSLREPSPTRQATPRMPTLTRACRRMRGPLTLPTHLIFRLMGLAMGFDVLNGLLAQVGFTHRLLRA